MVTASEIDRMTSTLVHIGTGGRARLTEYRARPVSKIVLVEPIEEQVALLAADLAGEECGQVVRGLVAANTGEAELRCWNMDRLVSVREAAPLLLELMPGLRIMSREQVPLITPPNLLAAIGIATLRFDLVVEFAGEEQEILTAWQAHGLLEKTRIIQIRIPEEPFFAGAASRPAIEALLVDAGFMVVDRDLSDPDWPVLTLHADETGRALRATEERVATLEQALADAEAMLKAKTATIAERDTALKAVEDQAARHTQQLGEITAARTAAEATLADTLAALEAAKAQAADREAALTEAESRASTLETALADAKSKAEAQSKSMAQLRSDNALLNESLLRDQYTQRRLNEDLRRALQLQEGLDTDLRDLRARYTELLGIKEQQTQLLRKLTPKLQLASRELHALSAANPGRLKAGGGLAAKASDGKELAVKGRRTGSNRRTAGKAGG